MMLVTTEQVSGNRLRVLLALGVIQARNDRGFAPIREIGRMVGMTMHGVRLHLLKLDGNRAGRAHAARPLAGEAGADVHPGELSLTHTARRSTWLD